MEKGGKEDGVLSLILAVELVGSFLLVGTICNRRQLLLRLTSERQERKLLVLFASLWRALERGAQQERQ